jgi:hypothetical protein
MMSSIWNLLAPSFADHLWQSTLFAGATGLLTLVLRKNSARLRYSLWLAASLKFLVPFSLLGRAGRAVHMANDGDADFVGHIQHGNCQSAFY